MVVVSWHHLQACDKISLPVAYDFVAHYRSPAPKGEAYKGTAPEPNVPIPEHPKVVRPRSLGVLLPGVVCSLLVLMACGGGEVRVASPDARPDTTGLSAEERGLVDRPSRRRPPPAARKWRPSRRIPPRSSTGHTSADQTFPSSRRCRPTRRGLRHRAPQPVRCPPASTPIHPRSIRPFTRWSTPRRSSGSHRPPPRSRTTPPSCPPCWNSSPSPATATT